MVLRRPYKESASGVMAIDATNLYLGYDVSGDDNPMRNAGKDVNRLFVTGDSVDLQLGVDPVSRSQADRSQAVGDLRLLFSVFGRQAGRRALPLESEDQGRKQPVTFTCPWRPWTTVDRVEVLCRGQDRLHPSQRRLPSG